MISFAYYSPSKNTVYDSYGVANIAFKLKTGVSNSNNLISSKRLALRYRAE